MSDEPSVAQLQQQLEVMKIRLNDITKQCQKRGEIQQKKIADLQNQNEALRSHLKYLDKYIKQLSLVHSQLTAAPSYKLEKQDVDELLSLVQTL